MTIIKKTRGKYWWGYGEKGTMVCMDWLECKYHIAIMKNSIVISQKLKNKTTT